MFFKIGALRNFVIFTGKHLCCSLFLLNLQVWRLELTGKVSWKMCVTDFIFKKVHRQPLWGFLIIALLKNFTKLTKNSVEASQFTFIWVFQNFSEKLCTCEKQLCTVTSANTTRAKKRFSRNEYLEGICRNFDNIYSTNIPLAFFKCLYRFFPDIRSTSQEHFV